jgi:tetratricopeptide (TPR) repeat protein
MRYQKDNRGIGIKVDIIEGPAAFCRLRDDWEVAYDADPDAHYFLSWQWLASYLLSLQGPWFVLAARPAKADAPYVGFFPLRLRTKERGGNGRFFNDIIMGGNYWADYTGLVCMPQYEDAVVSAFAEQLKKLNWAYLRLDNFRASDARLEQLLWYFPEKKFDIKMLDRVNSADNIDNCICPYVALPDDWDAYVGTLSANTRQKMRRFLRQLDNSSELQVTVANANTVERDLDIVLRFWRAKWAARKGDRIETLVRANRANFLSAFQNGQLFLPMLWRGEEPLGGLAFLIDERKKALLFYLGARDENVTTPPPGFLLHAYSLRHAVSRGIRTYDFLRGNEPYKYMFNAAELRIKCIEVATKTRKNLGGRLDRRSLPVLVERAVSLHKCGRVADAERGYRQALRLEPGCVDALNGLGQLMASRGEYNDAIRLYRRLLKLRPESAKVWVRLGKAYHVQRQLWEAVDCYEAARQHQPEYPGIQYALGLALLQLGKLDEAVAELGVALDRTPNLASAQQQWLKAVGLLGEAMPARRRQLVALCLARANRDYGTEFAAQCRRAAMAIQAPLGKGLYGLKGASQGGVVPEVNLAIFSTQPKRN